MTTTSTIDDQKRFLMGLQPAQDLQMDTTVHTLSTTSPLVGLISGCAGAVALVYVGQPLDTIKVRMQLSTASRAVTSTGGGNVSMWSCVRDMWRQALVTPAQHQRLDRTTLVRGTVNGGSIVEACTLPSATVTQVNRTAAVSRMARLMYAGTGPALLANVAENGVLFAAYGPCQRLVAFAFDLLNGTKGHSTVNDIDKKLGPAGMATAGSLASFCSAFALCPTELIKVRLQAADLERSNAVNNNINNLGMGVKHPPVTRAAAGTLQVVANVWTTEGGLRGMYRGFGSTVAREMPGYYVFFLAYEASRTYLNEWHHSTATIATSETNLAGGHSVVASERNEEPTWVTMTAGAAAGMCLWLVIYPVDAIKSRIQASGGTTENSSSNFLKAIMLSVRKEGPLALYRGLAPTLLRTVPASAVMFWTVERTTTLLSDYGL